MCDEENIVIDEVQNVVTSFNIDKSKFFKVSDEVEESVIEDTYYSFVDVSQYSTISINKIYDKLDDRLSNNDLTKSIILGERSWEDFLKYIFMYAPKSDNSAYLCISGTAQDEDFSAVYQGELSAIVKVLFEGVPLGNGGDFTIVSNHFNWLIYYNDSQETLCYIQDTHR